jgi:hypothetical protein
MKILSVSDVITNSSSEVFIIDSKDLNKLAPECQKYFKTITKQNVFEKFLNYELRDVIDTLCLPSFLSDYDFIEEISKLDNDKATSVLEIFLKDLLDKAIFEEDDDSNSGYSRICLVEDELLNNNIEYIKDRA